MLDREAAIAWYRRNRERSRALFDLVASREGHHGAYYKRPIALRHPIVFYEGHLPAFSFNTLVKKALGGPGIDSRLEALFARGIDPHEAAGSEAAAGPKGPALHQRDVGRVLSDPAGWPSQSEVLAFAAEADRRVLDALCGADLERPGHPLLDRAEAVFTILEHEAMHHETLLYMWHRLPFEDKCRPTDSRADLIRSAPLLARSAPLPPPQEWIEIPAGCVTLGADREDLVFGWDNELPRRSAEVDGFAIQRINVTNAQFLEFVEAGGYGDARWWREEDWKWVRSEQVSHPLFWERGGDATGRTGRTKVLRYEHNHAEHNHAEHDREREWYWRGMFERIPLPLAWPVYVSYAEAAAYARWRGARLMTEAEYQRAAFGVPSAVAARDGERKHPWGNASPSPEHGVFDRLRAFGASASLADQPPPRLRRSAEASAKAEARDQVSRAEADSSWDPEPAGTHPEGRSAWGVDDLAGNGWEWTSTVFAPFPGFKAMASYPEYSADFFDGEHFVMKGASPATAAELLRPTFRNWFRPRYPYVYATFRCVAERTRTR